ncbi:MAG: hypothetical protein SPI30_00045 [Prevotella sp.]|nr:hypothetical protein [Prevotella sp.]
MKSPVDYLMPEYMAIPPWVEPQSNEAARLHSRLMMLPLGRFRPFVVIFSAVSPRRSTLCFRQNAIDNLLNSQTKSAHGF